MMELAETISKRPGTSKEEAVPGTTTHATLIPDATAPKVPVSVEAYPGIEQRSAGPIKVWILGSSIVNQALVAARQMPEGVNLGLTEADIIWQGYDDGVHLSSLGKYAFVEQIAGALHAFKKGASKCYD
ncbi:hypothetical protein DPMN_104141 [Dreissena polymorpha]|uniref:Uncharacterized protein n=1 Tax=Dreissena polymorpha TaxID=45954 RepID=A0A9D4JZT2_DREPO|nr:hypothetical protein DPMN_104141 [Dreissena polymorpha]